VLRQRAGETRQILGEPRLEFTGDVDRGEQLVGQVQRQRLLDLRLVEQVAAQLDPLVGVERLRASPRRHRRHDGQHGGQADQQCGKPARALPEALARWGLVVGHVVSLGIAVAASPGAPGDGLRSLVATPSSQSGDARSSPVVDEPTERPVVSASMSVATVVVWIASRSRSS
jgi:hypothetical protein